MQHPPDFMPFVRGEHDDDWDAELPCEKGPACDDPHCPTRSNRDAMRIALGSLVEGLEAVALVQALALDHWGACATPDCTFEAEMQMHFSDAGTLLGSAFTELLDGIMMWKALPLEWPELERETALEAIRSLKALNLEAQRQIAARRAGSPDPRDPSLTPKAN